VKHTVGRWLITIFFYAHSSLDGNLFLHDVSGPRIKKKILKIDRLKQKSFFKGSGSQPFLGGNTNSENKN
jgi:hypothetical protein